MKKLFILIFITTALHTQGQSINADTVDENNKSLVNRRNYISYSLLAIPYGNVQVNYEHFVDNQLSVKTGGLINMTPSSSFFDRRLGYRWMVHAGMSYYPLQDSKNKFFTGISGRRGLLVDVFYLDNKSTLNVNQYTYQYMSLLLTNGVLVQVAKQLSLTIELGLGFKRLQRVSEVEDNNSIVLVKDKIKNIDFSPDAQLSFCIGFRL
jgi:hypothetical protein